MKVNILGTEYTVIVKKSPMCKPIICVETGETFDYMKQAVEKYNIPHTCISACCRGKQKTAGGYHWKYIK